MHKKASARKGMNAMFSCRHLALFIMTATGMARTNAIMTM
jgi:hypothetical protein